MRFKTMKRCLIWALWAMVAVSAIGCSSQSSDSAESGAAKEQALATRPDKAEPNDWCKEHALPESMCTKCHPELAEKYKEAGDFCAEHGLPESVCPKCNPIDPPGAVADAADAEWCKGHGLPESHCTKCHPELTDKFKEAGDWCEEHGFPESACPECNPMQPPGATAAANTDWCGEHALPESKCTKCNPELTAKFKEQGDWCAEHGFPESACPKCNPQTPPGGIAQIPGIEPGTQIIFKQTGHEKAVGIETVPAREVPVGLGTRAPARIEFNRNHLADVRAAVPGIVREVLVDLGQKVEKGTPLFVLESAHVGEVQAQIRSASEELKTARANLERQEKLFAKGLSAERKVEVARRDSEEAESRLSSLRSSLRLSGGTGTSSTGRYTLRAPIDGTIVYRPGVVGAFATEETSLATVADTSTMWAMLDVAEQESFALKNGQPVVLTVDGAQGLEFAGKVSWIAPEVDSRTRTVKVRAEIDNTDGRLRSNQFARAEIGIAPDLSGVVVPKGAVQRLSEGTVVFVRKEEGTYEPRVVEAGRSDGEIVQVRGNLKVGESVVTTGAFILKTELSKDSIGAGCCEVPEE